MDIHILCSRINTELRDNPDYTLEDVCANHDWDMHDIMIRLNQAGYEYSDTFRKFW